MLLSCPWVRFAFSMCMHCWRCHWNSECHLVPCHLRAGSTSVFGAPHGNGCCRDAAPDEAAAAAQVGLAAPHSQLLSVAICTPGCVCLNGCPQSTCRAWVDLPCRRPDGQERPQKQIQIDTTGKAKLHHLKSPPPRVSHRAPPPPPASFARSVAGYPTLVMGDGVKLLMHLFDLVVWRSHSPVGPCMSGGRQQSCWNNCWDYYAFRMQGIVSPITFSRAAAAGAACAHGGACEGNRGQAKGSG